MWNRSVSTMATAGKIDVTPLPHSTQYLILLRQASDRKIGNAVSDTCLVVVNVKDEAQQRALLLYQAGEATQEILESLADTGENDDCRKAIDKLEEYFSPRKNVNYEIFQFRQLSKILEKQRISSRLDFAS